MRRYEIQDVVVQREVALPPECNGCGVLTALLEEVAGDDL